MLTEQIAEFFGPPIFNAIHGAHDELFSVFTENPIVARHSRQVSALVTEEIKLRLSEIDGIVRPSSNRADFALTLGTETYKFRVHRATLPRGASPNDCDPNLLSMVGNKSNAHAEFDFIVLWVGGQDGLSDVWLTVPAGRLKAPPGTQMSRYTRVDGRLWIEAQKLAPDTSSLEGLRVDPVEPDVDLGLGELEADSRMGG